MAGSTRAADRYKARERIVAILSELRPDDRVTIAEDVLYEVEQLAQGRRGRTRSRSTRSEAPPIPQPDETPNGAESVSDETASNTGPAPLWRQIETYCRSRPSASYDFGEVADALLPGKARGAARTHVYVTIKRKSDKSDRPVNDRRFLLTDDGKFSLANTAIGRSASHG